MRIPVQSEEVELGLREKSRTERMGFEILRNINMADRASFMIEQRNNLTEESRLNTDYYRVPVETDWKTAFLDPSDRNLRDS